MTILTVVLLMRYLRAKGWNRGDGCWTSSNVRIWDHNLYEPGLPEQRIGLVEDRPPSEVSASLGLCAAAGSCLRAATAFANVAASAPDHPTVQREAMAAEMAERDAVVRLLLMAGVDPDTWLALAEQDAQPVKRTISHLLSDGSLAKDGNEASATLAHLRSIGWSVAVHNDYRLDGAKYTFWLMTRGETALKGEGETDAIALAQILLRALALDAPSRTSSDVRKFEEISFGTTQCRRCSRDLIDHYGPERTCDIPTSGRV